MYSFEAQNVTEALQKGLEHLLRDGITEQSRNGPVIVAPGPVCTEYVAPRNRVLYSATRDANCFFHFFESLWMLNGDNDIEFPCYFASTYGQYSDDGKTMWDAYGHRWRNFFGWDQLNAVVEELKANPASRRCVIAMWNADASDHINPIWTSKAGVCYHDDFGVATNGGKAVPCNTHAYVDTRGGKLNLTICNRSNDALFGCYGANMVHMSFLAEYLAMRVGVPVGVYRQFSNNLHAYTDVFDRVRMEVIINECYEALEQPLPESGPALEPGFDDDLKLFMPWARSLIRGEDDDLSCDALQTEFFKGVAVPLFDAWYWRKQKVPVKDQLETLKQCTAPDWRKAAEEWIQRRIK